VTDRIVIAGTGVVSPLGAGLADFASALYEGVRADAPCTRFEGHAAEIADFDPQPWLGSGFRAMDRTARLLSVAVHLALSEAGVGAPAGTEVDPDLGLICGTMLGGIHSITSFDWDGITEGPEYVSPMGFANTVINSAAGQAAIKFKLRGVNSTICAGLSSGLYALGYAEGFLQLQRARALLAGGVDELSEEMVIGAGLTGALSPARAARPFAEARDGIVPAEGAAFLLLERGAEARARGVTPTLEIAGFGSAYAGHAFEAHAPMADAARSAIRQALQHADIDASQIGCIVASANGSRDGDATETRALSQVFGDGLDGIPICAPKASFGEAMGASGALCVVVAALALSRQCLPPTAGYDGSAYRLCLSDRTQAIRSDYALVDAFDCAGTHAALVLRRLPAQAAVT